MTAQKMVEAEALEIKIHNMEVIHKISTAAKEELKGWVEEHTLNVIISEASSMSIPEPQVRPFGGRITKSDTQDVWDAFVKPDQDIGLPQSVEMRCLMAILRAYYAGAPE